MSQKKKKKQSVLSVPLTPHRPGQEQEGEAGNPAQTAPAACILVAIPPLLSHMLLKPRVTYAPFGIHGFLFHTLLHTQTYC